MPSRAELVARWLRLSRTWDLLLADGGLSAAAAGQVDVVKGRGSGFSVEAPRGVRFLIRSRMFDDAESALLEAEGDPPTGARAEPSAEPVIPDTTQSDRKVLLVL